jgi:hypothetical protein
MTEPNTVGTTPETRPANFELFRLSAVYLALLRVPHSCAWRAQNQQLYVELRNLIAKSIGLPAEEVQNYYEAQADG